jgi:2-oxoglutarate ferredoxin oxidoreductase subunit alpha
MRINPVNLISVLHYDGTPITARFIQKEIAEIVAALNVRPPPIKKDKAA